MDAEVVIREELLARLRISKTTLGLWMKDRSFPQPISGRWWWPNVVEWWEREQRAGPQRLAAHTQVNDENSSG